MKRLLIVLMTVFFLAGCASVDVADYRNEKPVLDLQTYFNGTVDAWGVFQDRSGKVVKRFHVVIESSWQGKVGTLDERFVYSDGTTQRRVWTVTKHDSGRYTGRADDVVGEAQGEAQGNALRWRYTLALPVDGTVYNVEFDDWMFLMDDKTMLNRSFMSKFGVELGQVTLSFRKR
ncbi:DUF3833 domain-containing protein [Niveibacterium sp. 24ML]|uniref:DUF3833 domain-containing protein n=1 Tax=Niveibacterium sp. 24ML TaxID=2985512 RepID=UPI002271B263|nr:DUF3833 domain-containing protein [Niveibacterium sp. 24ML]MCX9154910.1 DUF3833 domain-containing protein [Niveibacterium sp. 24ML]